MDLKKLKEIIGFMNDNDLVEVEIEEKGEKIKLRKFSPEQPAIIASQPVTVSPEKDHQDKTASSRQGLIEIKSPMVGTFYRAPAPGASPFVEVEQKINPGDVVCILEAMKLMNEIKAETGGIIKEILVENGVPVEFGETLFLVQPV